MYNNTIDVLDVVVQALKYQFHFLISSIEVKRQKQFVETKSMNDELPLQYGRDPYRGCLISPPKLESATPRFKIIRSKLVNGMKSILSFVWKCIRFLIRLPFALPVVIWQEIPKHIRSAMIAILSLIVMFSSILYIGHLADQCEMLTRTQGRSVFGWQNAQGICCFLLIVLMIVSFFANVGLYLDEKKEWLRGQNK